jgi:hypothetical protein
MKRRYKVLPLNFPFNQPYEVWKGCAGDEIIPLFCRNGRYMDRKWKMVWIEVDGRAWRHPFGVEMFLFDVAHIGANRLEDHVFQALDTLLHTPRTGVSWRSHPDLYEKWSVEDTLRAGDQIRRENQLHLRKFRKST